MVAEAGKPVRQPQTYPLVLEMLEGEAIADIDAAQWEALSAAAIEANPFYSHRYVTAGLKTIDRGSRLRALVIWTADRRLVGLLPFRLSRSLPRVAVGASNLYQMSGQPLLHRDFAREAIGAWREAISAGSIPRRWRFPHLRLDSAFARLCEERGDVQFLEAIALTTYSRARLTRLPNGFEGHVQNVISRRRAKGIQRTLRRLEEQGEVRFERASEPGLVRQRVEEFLAMEHAGWKGEAGTSFLSEPEHAQFLRDVVADNATVSTDSLLLDGRAIAVNINLLEGDMAFTPKCAFDERFRKFSPGLALEYLVIEAFYTWDGVSCMDATTTADGHLIQGLWNEAVPMGTMLVGPPGLLTQFCAQLHLLAGTARGAVRQVIGQQVLALVRRSRHARPELLRRLGSIGQTMTCMLLYV